MSQKEETLKVFNWKNWLRSLGPGIIIAALVFGPSKITVTTVIGADYGYDLLWIVVVAIFFMVVFTNMSARIGIATNRSLLSSIQKKWGKSAGILVGLGIFLVTSSFQAGNSIGASISIAEPTNTSPVLWIIILNLVTIGLLFFKSFYYILEKIMISLIILMLLSFTITLFLSRPSFDNLFAGLIPSIPKGSVGLIIAFMASAFSIVGACYQSYLVQERKKIHPEIQQKGRESVLGILILGLMSSILLICSATILNPQGITIHSATDMGEALVPAFGKYASYIFMAGLFGASFSSIIGNATLGGTLSGDALGYGGSLNSGRTRLIIALIMIIGATVAIIYGKLPIQLIVFAQAVTIFIVPFIGFTIFMIANDKEIMGNYCNRQFSKVVGIVGLLIMTFLALNNVYILFIK